MGHTTASLIVGALCLCLYVTTAEKTQPPRIVTENGALVGTTLYTRGGREIFAFLGIPYAAPPVGELRFKSPQPPTPWPGERDASEEGNACIQQFVLIERLRKVITGNEDCLYLNVYTPKMSSSAKLPVMFYIHGGGYAGGSGSPSDYGPQLLLDREIVLVAINYRLGPLGFLSTGNTVLPGNLGLKDQRAALRWVHSNIRQFGGDPDSVTLFGESAGGGSVHLHLLSPSSRGLFHRGISQSGTALCPWAYSSAARHKQLATKLADLVKCPVHPSEAFLQCLMELPAEKIVSSLQYFIEWDMDPVVLFNPAIEPADVEDAFLTKDPWTLTSDLPWMVGFNQNEGVLKVASLTQGDVPGKMKVLNDKLYSILPMSLLYEGTAKNPDEVTEAIMKFYFGNSEKISLAELSQIISMYTDAWFSAGAKEAARRHSGPIYFYHFTYNSSFSLCNQYFNNPHYMGVCHFDELLYLFPMGGHSPKLILDDPDYIMSQNMIALWTNFAMHNVQKLEDFWDEGKEYSHENYLLISKEGFLMEKYLLAERDYFWQNLPYRKKPELSKNNRSKVSFDEL